MKIFIKKRKANYIYFILYFITVMMFLRSVLGFPSMITYSIDIANTVLLICLLKEKFDKKTAFFRNYIFLFLIYVFIGLILFGQPIILFLWGLRSNFRFYVFFLACALMLTKKDCNKILNVFKKLLVVNAVICTIQYFIFGYSRDFLGGLFGTASGCNGYMNVFMIITITYAAMQYLCREIGTKEISILVLLAVYISILSELKVFFVELIIIFVVAFLITRWSSRKLGIILLAIISVILIAWGVPQIYPEWSELFSIDGILENLLSEKGYTGQGDLNRLSAIISINKNFAGMNLFRSWFGTGLGSWEYSDTFSFLTSTNYLKYSSTHYAWISYAWLYLELGYVGLILFGGFFILVGFYSRRIKSHDVQDKILLDTAFIVAILSFVLAVFNVSLRMESGYHIYFVLAIPLIIYRTKNNN